jgi:phage I-like protein
LNTEETALAKAIGYTADEFQKIKEGKKRSSPTPF